jgi:hypothetical protein
MKEIKTTARFEPATYISEVHALLLFFIIIIYLCVFILGYSAMLSVNEWIYITLLIFIFTVMAEKEVSHYDNGSFSLKTTCPQKRRTLYCNNTPRITGSELYQWSWNDCNLLSLQFIFLKSLTSRPGKLIHSTYTKFFKD